MVDTMAASDRYREDLYRNRRDYRSSPSSEASFEPLDSRYLDSGNLLPPISRGYESYQGTHHPTGDYRYRDRRSHRQLDRHRDRHVRGLEEDGYRYGSDTDGGLSVYDSSSRYQQQQQQQRRKQLQQQQQHQQAWRPRQDQWLQPAQDDREFDSSQARRELRRGREERERLRHFTSGSYNNRENRERNQRPLRLADLNHTRRVRSGSETDDIICEKILLEVIHQMAPHIAQEVLYEAHYTDRVAHYYCCALINEQLILDTPALVEECVREVMLDDILDELIDEQISPSVSSQVIRELQIVSRDKRKAQLQQLNKMSGERLLEEMCIEQLLSLVGRQTRDSNEEAHNDQLLDGMISEILLTEMGHVFDTQTSTLENQPLSSHHQTITADISLDVLLEELRLHSAEDLREIDESEQREQELLQHKHSIDEDTLD